MQTPPRSAVDDPGRAGFPEKAVRLDVSSSERVPTLMEMVAGLSRADDASEVLSVFAKGFAQLYGPQGYISISTRGLAPGEYKVTRLLSNAEPSALGSADPWRDWASIPVHRGGFLGTIIRTAYPQVVHQLYLKDDPVIGDAMSQYGSMLAVPLFDNGEPLNWTLSFRAEPEAFTMQDLEESILRSNLGGAAVKNTMITRQLREAHLSLRDEVEQIAKIQKALLPDSLPPIKGLDIDVSYETFDQAGGDMYSLRPLREKKKETVATAVSCLDDSRWGILVADVSGHGPAAAVIMAMIQSIIETYPHEPDGPAEVLAYANQHLAAKRLEGRFVTAFLALYDTKSRELTYSSAGHNPPVWMRPRDDGWVMERLDQAGGIPLGILDDVEYEETSIQLVPGETVVLYTDGITEAMSPDGTMFGVEGIEASLTECTGYPQCVIGHVTTNVVKHQAGVRPNDDQTLVVLRVDS